MTISLSQQATAVELAFKNRRGNHIRLTELLREGDRATTEEKVRIAGMWLPELEAAHQTLAALAEKEKGQAA